ncbi:MAG: alpha/beta fold hydrolase [Promethearchaeota archaeon]
MALDESRGGEEGSGRAAVVFVHGSASCGEFWSQQVGALSGVVRAVAVDLPGHCGSRTSGLTGRDVARELSMEAYTGALDEVVRQLRGLGSAGGGIVLAGHSLGGGVVLSYYLEHPGLVDGLVLVGTGAKLRVSRAIFDLVDSNYEEFLDLMEVSVLQRPFRRKHPGVVGRIRRVMESVGPEVTRRDFEICDEFDVTGRLGEVRVPVLVLSGERDTLMPAKYGEFLAGGIPESEFHVLRRVGHFMMLEAADEVNRLVRAFLEKLQASSNP